MTGPRATGSSDPLKVLSSAQALFSSYRPRPQGLWQALGAKPQLLSSACSLIAEPGNLG